MEQNDTRRKESKKYEKRVKKGGINNYRWSKIIRERKETKSTKKESAKEVLTIVDEAE
jgi:hypothetical protein